MQNEYIFVVQSFTNHHKAMEKSEKINRYKKLKGQCGFISRICGVSPSYVNMVLNGDRTPRTQRANKANKIFKVADDLLLFQENAAKL